MIQSKQQGIDNYRFQIIEVVEDMINDEIGTGKQTMM